MPHRPNQPHYLQHTAALARFLDGDPEPHDVKLIAEALAGDPIFGKELIELLEVDELLRQRATGDDAMVDAVKICLADPGEIEQFVQSVNDKLTPDSDVITHVGPSKRGRSNRLPWVAAVLVLGVFVFWWGRDHQSQDVAIDSPDTRPNSVLSPIDVSEEGSVWVAVVRKAIDVDWIDEASALSVGETMTSRRIQFDRGLVELQTNRGALVRVQGPADLTVVNGMEVLCRTGRLRVDIPTSAHGFVVSSPFVNVVDRGTSFAMDVGGGSPTEVHVIDGMVELESKLPNQPTRELLEGQSISVNQGGIQDIPSRAEEFPSAGLMTSRLQTAMEIEMKAWKRRRDSIIKDPTCFVYFDFEEGRRFDTVLTNHSVVANDVADGTIVGCDWAIGRWRDKRAVEFRNDFDRLLVPLSKKLTSFSCMASVRVDSLNSTAISLLTIQDLEKRGMEWQMTPISGQEFGKLRLKCDDYFPTAAIGEFSSKPFFRPEKVGTWLRLAVVWDGEAGVCRQYVSGKLASTHQFKKIAGEQGISVHVDHLEIGNGGGEGRDAVSSSRYLSGRIDEFVMFDRVITAEEIRTHHDLNQVVWDNRTGDNRWGQPANWAAGITPDVQDYVTIDAAGDQYAHFSEGETPDFNAIRVGTFRGRTGLLEVSGGIVTAMSNPAAASRVGVAGGDGCVIQRGGGVNFNSLQVGLDSGSTGIYRLSGGELVIHRGLDSVSSINLGCKGGVGTFEISGGSLKTRFGVVLGGTGSIGTFRVQGSDSEGIAIGSYLSDSILKGTGSWIQNHGSTMQFVIDTEGVTPIVISTDGGSGGGDVTFEPGSLIDVGFAGETQSGSWDVMSWEGELTDNGLQFSDFVDQERWAFAFVDTDGSGTNDTLRVTAVSR